MNKVYRVVWNAGAGKWVAVSELAKAPKKKSGRALCGMAMVSVSALVAECAPFGAAFAADAAITAETCATLDGRSGTLNTWGVCTADAVKTLLAGNNYSIGIMATSTPTNSLAGGMANASLDLAIGAAASTNNQGAIAISGSTQYATSATGNDSVAIGTATTTNGRGAVAIGVNITAGAAAAVAIGSHATTTLADTVAIGTSATVSAANSVALGNASVANRANTVSVGSSVAGSTRQLVNVGAGTQANDAVNVGQFSSMVNALGGGASINAATGAVTGPTYHVRGGTQTDVGTALNALDTGLNNVVIYDDAGKASITLAGRGAAAPVAMHNVANGVLSTTSTDAVNGSQLNTTNQQVDTNTTHIAGNTSNITQLLNGTAGLVQQANATAPIKVAASNGGTLVDIAGTAGNRQLRGVAEGTQDADAVNFGQLQALQGQVGDIGALAVMYDDAGKASITLGGRSAAAPVAMHNVANGVLSTTSTDAVNGSQLNTTNQQVATNTTHIAGNTSDITQLLNGTAGLVQQANATAPITVAAHNGGTLVDIAGTDGHRQLRGLADGTQDADAVNFGQLQALQGQVGDIGALAVMYDDAGKASITLGGRSAAAPVALHNVANGVLSTTSTDAVNGSQLNTTNQQVDTNTTHIAGNTSNITQLLNGTAGLVQQANATAPITVAAHNGGTLVDIAGTDGHRQLRGVADGRQDADAVNFGQLQALQGQVGDIGALAVMYDDAGKASITLGGRGATAPVALHNVANGVLSSTSTDAVNGSQLNTTNQQVATNTTHIAGNTSDITQLLNGTAGLVQQANATAPITVAASNGGTLVDIAGADGHRQLRGVADGTQEDDAVNFGQLQALQGQVGDIGALAVMYDDAGKASITLGGRGATAPVAMHNVANGSSTYDAVNFGQLSGLQSELQNQIIGINTQMGGLDHRVTILENETRTPPYLDAQGGSGPNNNANAGDTPGVALGYNSAATGNNASAVGQNAQALGEYGTAVGADAYAAGANDTALGGNAKVHADGSVAVGVNANVSSNATNAVAVGADSAVHAASGTAIGQGASVAATAINAVAIGAGSQATQANTVSVGSVGNERTVSNVAPGVNGTDAVNVNQLQGTQNWAKSYIDQQTSTLNIRITRMTQRANAGIAAAMAMTNIPQAYAPNQSSLGAGIGSFGGESAVAVGMSAITPDGRWVLKASVTGNSRGEAGVGFGAAMVW